MVPFSSFSFYFPDSINLGETVIHCGLEEQFLCGSFPEEPVWVQYFWLLLVWMTATSVLRMCWPLSPWLGLWLVLWGPEPALNVERSLFFALLDYIFGVFMSGGGLYIFQFHYHDLHQITTLFKNWKNDIVLFFIFSNIFIGL